MKVNRTLPCERENLTADVADLVLICMPSAEETLGTWLKDMVEMFEGGLQSAKDMEAEGGVSAIPSHNLSFQPCLILPVVTYLSHRAHLSALVHCTNASALAQGSP